MTRIYKRDIRNCIECNSVFSVFPSSYRKYCSKVCSSPHVGGYRPRSGSVRTGYYNGIFCGSTWELCWVIYAIDHQIEFTRFPKLLIGNGIKYFPDFLLNDGKTIIEIKGPRADMNHVTAKTNLAIQLGYTVNLYTEDKLQNIFSYVEEKYNTKKYYTLYDEYKPEFAYKCSNCNNLFTSDKKRLTYDVFCTRKCAGAYRRLSRTKSIVIGKNNYIRRLSREEALSIFIDTRSMQVIASEYKITKNAVWYIKKKKSYKWIHIPID